MVFSKILFKSLKRDWLSITRLSPKLSSAVWFWYLFGERSLIALTSSLLTPKTYYGTNSLLSEPIFGLFVKIIGIYKV